MILTQTPQKSTLLLYAKKSNCQLTARAKYIFLETKQEYGVYLINFEKIIGLKVITTDAHTLGEVKGARVDTTTWEIKYLNVKLADNAANRLGMKKRFGSSTISLPVSIVQAVSECVTIAKSLEQLEKAKEIVEYKE